MPTRIVCDLEFHFGRFSDLYNQEKGKRPKETVGRRSPIKSSSVEPCFAAILFVPLKGSFQLT